jgi:hypothetical protein
MERRELFKVLGATLIAARLGTAEHEHPTQVKVDIESYLPRFFSEAQYRTVDRLTDIIVPSDAGSPGAHYAGVRYYIDTVLHYADAPTQQNWRAGLGAVDSFARSHFGKNFGECGAKEQEQIVEVMAQNEKNPSTELERFFGTLKTLTVEAYVLSEIGMTRYLGYKGNTATQEFVGCTHPQHKSA